MVEPDQNAYRDTMGEEAVSTRNDGGGGRFQPKNHHHQQQYELRPVFLGNLNNNYAVERIRDLFERPIAPPNAGRSYRPVPVDRIDVKRGYCFVFLKDCYSLEDKDQSEAFVSDINGMHIPGLSNALRVEFARGDGKIKRKEEERRKSIAPSDTLFVVNFHEETTKREDLQMLFEPFGELLRIDMKRNYAFVQFRTIEEATKAQETTNGGKLDQSVLTVEFAARDRLNAMGGGGGDRRDGGGRDRRRDGGGGGGGSGRDRYSYDDRPNYRRSGSGGSGGGGGGGRYDDRDRGGYDDRRRGRYDDDDVGGGGGRYPGGRRDDSPPPPPYRGRPRDGSRSRSPPPAPRGGYGYRGSRSPPRGGGRYDDRYDDYRDRRGSSPVGGGGGNRDRGDRGGGGGGGGGRHSPDRDYPPPHRGDRGYRP